MLVFYCFLLIVGFSYLFVLVSVSGVVLLWGVALTLFDLVLVYICDSLIYIKRAYLIQCLWCVVGNFVRVHALIRQRTSYHLPLILRDYL